MTQSEAASKPLWRRVLPWVGVWVLLLALWACVPASTWDEPWFAQVVDRTAHHGAVPYRDAYFAATPLSLYVGIVVSAVVGTQLFVLRAIAAVYAVIAAAAGWSVATRLGLGRAGRFAISAALLGFGSGLASPPSHYGALAFAGAALVLDQSVAIVLAPDDEQARKRTVLAALMVALTFCSKQSIGIYVASLPFVAIASRHLAVKDVVRTLARAALVGLATVGIVVLPIALSGGLSAFADDGFTAQGDYVSLGGVPWSDGLTQLWRDVGHAQDPGRWPAMVRGAAFVLPLVAVGLLILAFALGDRRARVLSLIALLGGAAMTAHAIPRADETHVVAGSVGSIFAIGIAAGLLRQRVTARSVRLAIASVGGIAFVVLAAGAVSQLRLGDRGVAHAKGIGVPLGPGELDALARLRDATNGTVFVFSPDAAHVYLYGGLQNPTPYDFPIRTAFGGQGERDVAEAVRAGHLSVCVGFSYGPPLAPTEIDAAIAETRVPIGDYRPVCILQAPVASPP